MTKRHRDKNKIAITSATTTVAAYDHLYAPSAKAMEFSDLFHENDQLLFWILFLLWQMWNQRLWIQKDIFRLAE